MIKNWRNFNREKKTQQNQQSCSRVMLPIRFLIFSFTLKSKVLDPPRPYFTFIHFVAFHCNYHEVIISGIPFWRRDSHYKCIFFLLQDMLNFDFFFFQAQVITKSLPMPMPTIFSLFFLFSSRFLYA